jgi:thymidylate kinase
VIVEFIGCDGAGKSTLSRMLGEPGVLEGRAVAMADLLLDRRGLSGITHPTAMNVVQEVGGLPFLLRAYGRRRAYLAFARRMHARYAPTTYDRLNGMRGIARRVGMYELARSRAADRIVLSDEGTVLSAYLFALTDVELDRSDVERFAELVPRPDRIVYVKAPIASLVRRATTRPNRRRQHAGRPLSEVERTIRRTVDVFDLVAETSPLRDRVLVVENDDDDYERLHRRGAGLATELRLSASAGVEAYHTARPASDRLVTEPQH